jgi:hypothetical protein
MIKIDSLLFYKDKMQNYRKTVVEDEGGKLWNKILILVSGYAEKIPTLPARQIITH